MKQVFIPYMCYIFYTNKGVARIVDYRCRLLPSIRDLDISPVYVLSNEDLYIPHGANS